MQRNLTQCEIARLNEEFNLTDGHAYRLWTPAELDVIAKAPELLTSATRRDQPNLEAEYVSAFFELARQTLPRSGRSLICPSASIAIEIVANHLRLTGRSLALIEPCYDSLADTFKRHRVTLESVPDQWLREPDFIDRLESLRSDAIFLVLPNNPTGSNLTLERLEQLVAHCERTRKLLILDCCFRFYVNDADRLDHYGVLADSDVDFMVVEATGKTWPTSELKAPILFTSSRLVDEIYDIYTDLILHASPFVVRLLTEFVLLSLQDNLASVLMPVDLNRAALHKAVAGTLLAPVEIPSVPFSWLALSASNAEDLRAHLDASGVFVLPGGFFYWSDPSKGSSFVRVALARDPLMFSKAAELLGQLCRGFLPESTDG